MGPDNGPKIKEKKKMRNKKVLEMTTLAMFASIIFLMAWFPQIGFIAIPALGVSITIVHIPVIIGAMYGGRKVGLYLGLVFGLSSWAMALMRASQPFDLMFQNPILAVVPRALFGLSVWYVFAAFKKLVPKKPLSLALTFITVTLIHTVLVMGVALAMSPFYEGVLGAELFMFIVTVALPIVAPFEMTIAALVGTPIVLRLMQTDLFKEDREKDAQELNIDVN